MPEASNPPIIARKVSVDLSSVMYGPHPLQDEAMRPWEQPTTSHCPLIIGHGL